MTLDSNKKDLKGDKKNQWEDGKFGNLEIEEWDKKSWPMLPVMLQLKAIRSKESFIERGSGLFHPDSVFKLDGRVPKIIGTYQG